jgi:iron complex transport system ATP-binding protein
MTRLETRALTLVAGDRVLCRELSVAFGAGQNWAILGANGSGKTTLLYTLAGLRAPDGGSVLLDGSDVRGWPARRRALQVGLLFQDYTLAFPATVLETVLTGRHPHLGRWRFEGDDDLQHADTALDQVALGSFATRLLPTLSGGERRRAEIAAVLAQDAPICLWDEPNNHLDLRHRSEILRKLAARAQRPEHLNLFVLHDVNAAKLVCSHALLLFPGGGTGAGPITEVVTRAALERAYECKFHELRDGDSRYYFPT